MAVAAKQVTGQNFSLITRLPDDDTKEISLYGSSYTVVKAALFNIHRMEHVLADRAAAGVDIMLTNKEGFKEVIDALIADPAGAVEKKDQWYELKMTIKKHNQYRAAIKWCRSKSALVKMYGRLIGAQEQGEKIKTSPEQMKIWRDSVLQLAGEPLEYASVERDYV